MDLMELARILFGAILILIWGILRLTYRAQTSPGRDPQDLIDHHREMMIRLAQLESRLDFTGISTALLTAGLLSLVLGI